MPQFRLKTGFVPAGDQPAAIQTLVDALSWRGPSGERHRDHVLLGVTGSGKTFTMSHVVQELQRPALVIAPNKTLAAQLFQEFKSTFPENAVEYFVSYYDYYQPEAYVPTRDIYIEKDAKINDTIDRMRHSATRALLTRQDVIIVASVSCIYGIGSAEAYYGQRVVLEVGARSERDEVIRELVEVQYDRNDFDLYRGTFRVRGDVLEIVPAAQEGVALRVEWFGDEIDRILEFDPLTGEIFEPLDKVSIFPATHYVSDLDLRSRALQSIRLEIESRLREFKDQGKLLEAQRLEQRTMYDLELLEQTGHCKGIENYSRHFTGRDEGSAPPTLLDYFPDNALVFVDESHVTIPQIGAMWKGDRARKQNLVDYGFRLPSALDNRPLRFQEFDARLGQVVYVSATPGDYELERAQDHVVQLIVRPTGLVDPRIEIRPVSNQVDDLLGEIRTRVQRGGRILVTTLTKRLAEHLTEYYQELGVRVRYMHSDIDALERMEIVRDLRLGVFDVLVGINLLREGLDIPEVSLVAILDADKEGFLRSTRSLIQTTGRAARNVEGLVIMYADTITRSMRNAMEETDRRREKQEAYNELHGIEPKTIQKEIMDMGIAESVGEEEPLGTDLAEVTRRTEALRKQMWQAAQDLDFEKAASLRDTIQKLEQRALQLQSDI